MAHIPLPYTDIHNRHNDVVCCRCGLSTWKYRSYKPPSCDVCLVRLSCLANDGCPFDRLIFCHDCREEYALYYNGGDTEVYYAEVY